MTTVSVFTVAEVADQLRIDRHKVLAWIKTGELVARNLASKPSTRPLYRIKADDLQAFLDARASMPAPARTTPRRVRGESYREFV